MSGDGSNGAAGDWPVPRPSHEAIERGVDGVVPCARGAAHYQGTEQEDHVCAKEGGQGGADLGRCVQAAEEVGEVEVPEAVGAIETHELCVWET